jgi:carbon starvation protein CstA
MDVTLRDYERAEGELAKVEGRRGMTIHAVITLIVCAVLVAVNVFAAPEFPWSAFAVAGMLIGLGAHYDFGVRRLEQSLESHQREVEKYAIRARAA